ncbi:hypothetical protein BOS5A_211054 [Bosea sp. EC-HK365B]|nr:hypothetical protein BOS5A_211054 [Bosea sp. EC-HK365B]VXC97617.1 hypothetical protein BOSE125_90030 [Bosea sp. 125]
MKRSRAAPPAAAPSRWPLYRGTQLRLSTRFLKVFRQKWISVEKSHVFNDLHFNRQTEPDKSTLSQPNRASGPPAP